MSYKHGVDMLVTRLMLETGLMLAETGRFEKAISIIEGVKTFRDEIPHPGVCLGVTYLFQGESEKAVKQMEETLREFPGHPLALAMLGTALREVNSPQWRHILEQVVATGGRDQLAVDLANSVLQMSEVPPDRRTGTFKSLRQARSY